MTEKKDSEVEQKRGEREGVQSKEAVGNRSEQRGE